MANIIATWLYLDRKGEESCFPQTGILSSSPDHQNIYWRCVCCFFKLVRVYHPHIRCVLFSNVKDRNSIIDNVRIFDELDRLSVETEYVEFTYKLPRGYYHSFQNQLYEFDIFSRLLSLMDAEDQVLLLDSDCLVTRNLDFVFSMLDAHEALTMNTEEEGGTDPDVEINGITRRQMTALFSELSGRPASEPAPYLCGEFFCARYSFLVKIMNEFPDVFKAMTDRYERTHDERTIKFNEEAHFLSYFYWKHGIRSGTADVVIKRMWTLSWHNLVLPGDCAYPIWHVLSGKQTYEELLKKIDRITAYDQLKRIRKLDRMFLHPRKKVYFPYTVKKTVKYILKRLGLFDVLKERLHTTAKTADKGQ